MWVWSNVIVLRLLRGGMEFCIVIICGSGSSVGVATGYGLDGRGIKSRWFFITEI
jgi:hypothetical protein